MRIQLPLIFFLLSLLGVSCAGNAAGGDGVQEVATSHFDSTLYCFNGRSIAFAPSGQGVIGKDGEVVLEPIWNNVEFLDDNVMLLERSGRFFLSDSDGRLFSEGSCREDLERDFMALYDNRRVQDILYWDEVASRMDSLCAACLSTPKGKPLTDSRVISAYESLKELLENPAGHPDSVQMAKIESIVERFDRYRK